MTVNEALPEALARLRVLDQLEIGPVRVERRRLIAPYTVRVAGRSDTLELIYRYEEDVFEPEETASRNLACMITAQVALNYGLFCKQIHFHGPFERSDRQFLHEMAKNTAREIYVNKILKPNPFLKDELHGMPAIRLNSYLQAHLTFENSLYVREQDQRTQWSTGRQKIAVLSSGGKESLLTDGLLREIGQNVHPIFINESGKHWFTALNGYRYCLQKFPETARVWTNCDRLFNWMVRQLPFIREDHAKLRADIYPVRLWTVAVFLFGGLPLLRKRGIGRLAIGDEFDTTVRTTHEGIPHFYGLYDQSRYFDQALTRYFHRKQWKVNQFSIIRPLSELLVEKILVQRYPESQRAQVSCHAAHVQGDRVLPCGQCEKCSRVVSMLTALGEDPTRCGYTQAQIDRCLARVVKKGISQEDEGQQHLAFLLKQRNVLPGDVFGGLQAKERPEVEALRFDKEHAWLDDIPSDLRKPLYEIMLQHATGALIRKGKIWTPFDLLHSPLLYQPYPFEPPVGAVETNGSDDRPRSYMLGDLTWPEAQQRFREVDVALLPVGAIEQHGPHLPLDTDAFDADYLCRAVAERCSSPKPIVLPLIPYGVSYHHDDFAGTISIGPETLSRLVYEVGMSVARHGVQKLVIVNGHGGNAPTLHFAAQLINRDAHIFTCVDSGETSDADINQLADTKDDVHAGEIETSTSLATRPELVQMDKAKRFVPKFSSQYLNFSSKRSVEWYARTANISPEGVMGDPTLATKEKGERMWELMIEHLATLVEELKAMTLAEIHQRSGY